MYRYFYKNPHFFIKIMRLGHAFDKFWQFDEALIFASSRAYYKSFMQTVLSQVKYKSIKKCFTLSSEDLKFKLLSRKYF